MGITIKLLSVIPNAKASVVQYDRHEISWEIRGEQPPESGPVPPLSIEDRNAQGEIDHRVAFVGLTAKVLLV